MKIGHLLNQQNLTSRHASQAPGIPEPEDSPPESNIRNTSLKTQTVNPSNRGETVE